MKNLYVILFLLFACATSYAQKTFVDRTQTIRYNFKTGRYVDTLKQIRVHTPVIFEIQNINPFAYKIKITPKDSVIAASSFDKSMLQWISKTALEAAQNEIENTETAESTPTGKPETVGSEDLAKNEKNGDDTTLKKVNAGLETSADNDAMIANVERLELNILKIKTQLQDSSLQDTTRVSLENRITHLTNQVQVYKDSIKQNIEDANAEMKYFIDLRTNFMAAYSKFMIDCHRVFRITRNARLLTTIAEDPNLSDSIFRANYKNTFDQILLEIREDRNYYNEFRRTYSELNNLYVLLKHDPQLQKILTQTGIEKLYAYPDYIKEKADALHSRMVQLPIQTFMTQSEWIATKLGSKDAFQFRSVPLQPINDWIEFKVDISRKHESIPHDYYLERSFIYHQPTFGGTRVDFSLGLAASYFGSTSVYDLGYKSPGDTTGMVIYRKAREMIAPSLVGLVTMSVRKTKYAAWGGSAGLGIDVLNGKVQLSNFFVGPTVLLGKFDRIFLSGGASLRNVQQLGSGYEDKGSAGTATKISQILVDKYKIGFFLSVTYSLTDNAKKMLQSF